MTKPFKLRLNLPSFQLCRSLLAHKPSSTKTHPKAFHTAISFAASPAPPPSSPTQSAYDHSRTFEKLYNSPEVSTEFDANAEKFKLDQSATSFTVNTSPANSSWFSSEDEDDNGDGDGDGSEGQLSSCSSFSSSSDFLRPHPLKTPVDQKGRNEGKLHKMKKKEGGNVRKLKSLGRLLPCVVDGKVNESYAVMKKSTDPFDDFKMSMLEMVLEKQLSEPEELEKLLMCFLSLNAKGHHAVIVAAFTEVWEELYSS